MIRKTVKDGKWYAFGLVSKNRFVKVQSAGLLKNNLFVVYVVAYKYLYLEKICGAGYKK